MKTTEKVAVYQHPYGYAHDHGELEQAVQSHRANLDCKRAIEESINHHFDGMRLDRRAVSEVMAQFDPERVALILASTVSVKEWDERFSPSNRRWALSYPFPASVMIGSDTDRRYGYAVTTHSAILDGFIDYVRAEVKAREHPAEKDAAPETAKAEAPVAKPIKKKAHSYER